MKRWHEGLRAIPFRQGDSILKGKRASACQNVQPKALGNPVALDFWNRINSARQF
jgi:hypothetical protein